jgi:hypothetical protein
MGIVVARQGANGRRGDREKSIDSKTDKFNRERSEALRVTCTRRKLFPRRFQGTRRGATIPW